MGHLRNQLERSFCFEGHVIHMYRCWEEPTSYDIETAKESGEAFDECAFYDFFCGKTMACLNLGDPWYADEWDVDEDDVRECIYEANIDHFDKITHETDNKGEKQ